MKSIRVQNLRSLSDTDNMPIKAINMLVGGNSSGKSTYLRLFPLIKQSLGKKINGPILWAGDEDDYVDFGSFREAINNNSDSNNIKFKFNFDLDISNEYKYSYRNSSIDNIKLFPTDVTFSLQKFNDTDLDYVSDVTINVFGYTIFLQFSETDDITQIKINDIEYSVLEEDILSRQFYVIEKQLFDIPLYGIQETAVKALIDLDVLSIPSSNNQEDTFTKSAIIDSIFYEGILNTNYQHMLTESNIFDKAAKKSKKNKNNNPKITDMIIMYKIPYIFSNISRYLSEYFRNVYYIAPVRATAERYYRLRNAAVNEVDCRGKNLAVFVNSLKPSDLCKFQDWTLQNLGFFVEKSISEGHVSLKVRKDRKGKSVNLSDTGFGYSQILPIVTQLWYITARPNRPSYYRKKLPITVAIEQPELHLHPSLQAKLIDVIVKVMKDSSINNTIQFIIETHSETIINRLGNLIYKNKIDNDKIGIYIFDKELGDENTTIRFGKYDKDGYLENWPVGFFEPGEVN